MSFLVNQALLLFLAILLFLVFLKLLETGINAGAFGNWLAEVSAIILAPDDKRC
jgi:hypothetical protein